MTAQPRQFDPKAILADLKWSEGKLDGDLSSRVISELRDPSSRFDKYTLIHILGLTHDRQYRSIVESFINCERDPMLARGAFFVLCFLWSLDGDYTRQLVAAAEGLPWDEEEDVRIYALGRLGHVVRAKKDVQALSILISVAEDVRENKVMREVALEGLQVTSGASDPRRPQRVRPGSEDSARLIKAGRATLASWAGKDRPIEPAPSPSA